MPSGLRLLPNLKTMSSGCAVFGVECRTTQPLESRFLRSMVMRNDDDLDPGLDFDADPDSDADAEGGSEDDILIEEESTTASYTITNFDEGEDERPAAPPSRPKPPKPAAKKAVKAKA